MIIVFLQLRDPPVLRHCTKDPTRNDLQFKASRPNLLTTWTSFGASGRRTRKHWATFFSSFFRFYAHEFDYGKYVLSVRLGKMITKAEKKWQMASNNMLCIEEPFNTVRNLGNTADDTSFRGLHLELRRAFDLIAEAKLAELCDQYVFPKEEERIWQKPAPAPRPILLRSSSQQHSGRGGRGGTFRGNRPFHRNGNNNRRASSSIAYENNPMYIQANVQPTTLSPQDIHWYPQPQQHFPFHPEMLSSTLNALQIQEHSLRFHLYTQSQQFAQQQALAHAQRIQAASAQSTDRSRTNSFDNPPMTAPIRPEMYMYSVPLQFFSPQPGFTTVPPSPCHDIRGARV